jgi:hypothetical protein
MMRTIFPPRKMPMRKITIKINFSMESIARKAMNNHKLVSMASKGRNF